jgi:hypothetical protein
MEFARQEYFWLLLAMPLVVSLWGAGVWHRRRMRIRFGNIENLEAISRISHSGHAWMRGALFAASLILMTLGLAYPRMVLRELRPIPTPTDLVFCWTSRRRCTHGICLPADWGAPKRSFRNSW